MLRVGRVTLVSITELKVNLLLVSLCSSLFLLLLFHLNFPTTLNKGPSYLILQSLTVTVDTRRKVLTEDVEQQRGLSLTDHVLSAADDQLPVIIRRQISQGEDTLRIRGINL